MKNFFWILFLGNVILFAVMQGDGFGWGEQVRQAQPDLNSEMIRLMPAPQNTPVKPLAAPIQAPAPVSVTVPVLTEAAPVAVSPAPDLALLPSLSISQPSPKEDAQAAAKPDTQICLEWGDFLGADLTRASAALAALQLADKVSKRLIERDTGYWVYIPPLANKAAVNRKVVELRELGIREYYVVQTRGNLLNAISLGVFRSRDSAQNFLNHLRNKGVRSAKVGEHASKFKTTVFTLNRVDAATEAKLTAMQKDFAGTELNKVPCALTK
jgi:hypothetical protein